MFKQTNKCVNADIVIFLFSLFCSFRLAFGAEGAGQDGFIPVGAEAWLLGRTVLATGEDGVSGDMSEAAAGTKVYYDAEDPDTGIARVELDGVTYYVPSSLLSTDESSVEDVLDGIASEEVDTGEPDEAQVRMARDKADYLKDEYSMRSGPVPASPGDGAIIAHMGLSGQAPQNTEAAFIAAGEYGAWGIETDVQWTGDGVLVCFHDSRLDSTTDGSGRVCQLPWSYVSSVHYDNVDNAGRYPGSGIPQFGRYLDICRQYNCTAVIDIKGVPSNGLAMARQIFQEVSGRGMLGQAVFQCDEDEYLREIRNLSEEAKLWLLTASEVTGSTINRAMSLGCEAVNTNHVDASSISFLHSYSLASCYYTSYSTSQQALFRSYGIEYIMIDGY